MKKIILVAITVFASIGFANAQIKVVGDDYSDTLTGAKSYYERDVDFEQVFPSVSSKEFYGSLSPFFSSIGEFGAEGENYRFQINRTGDTVYLPHDINLVNREEFDVGFAIDSYGNIVSSLPSGYYIIQGYTFCSEETNKVENNVGFRGHYCTTRNTSKKLKENILIEKDKLKIERYIGYIILNYCNKEDTNRHIVAYLSLRACLAELDRNCSLWRNLNEDIVFTEFYNEVKKTFVGQKVVLSYGFYNHLKEIEFDSLVKDGFRGEVFKLNDRVFEFEDIVMRANGRFYAILNGVNTGSFALEVQNIKYLYSIADKELYPIESKWTRMGDIIKSRNSNNTIKDISALVAESGDHYLWIVREQDLSLMKKRARLSKEQRLKDEQSRLRVIKQQKQAQENEYKKLMIAKYGVEVGSLVGKHQVAINMTQEMCKDAWGRPMNTYRTTTKYGQGEVWCYNYKTRVYFYNGKVVQIDD